MAEQREGEYLLLASYCGPDASDCTDQRPCADCLVMCNVFDDAGSFIRELGPPLAQPQPRRQQ